MRLTTLALGTCLILFWGVFCGGFGLNLVGETTEPATQPATQPTTTETPQKYLRGEAGIAVYSWLRATAPTIEQMRKDIAAIKNGQTVPKTSYSSSTASYDYSIAVWPSDLHTMTVQVNDIIRHYNQLSAKMDWPALKDMPGGNPPQSLEEVKE